jgi:hypothetical protein
MEIKSNSITKYIDPVYIANQARMQRAPAERKAGCRVAIVIVEGCTDSLFYTTIFNGHNCLIIPSYGKQNALEILGIFLKDKTSGVLVIVDDDFDSLEGKSLRNDYIVVTDTHDLETLLFKSSAPNKLFAMLLLPEKRKFLDDFSKTVFEKLVELCSPLGHIRWYFSKNNIKVDFHEINFEAFIDKVQLTISLDNCITEVLARNNGSSIDKEESRSKIKKLSKKSIDPWLLCQGHDLIRILLLILPRILMEYAPLQKDDMRIYIESIHSRIPNEKRITEQLILGFENDFFRQTIIYSDIKNWETRNTPYRLLNIV